MSVTYLGDRINGRPQVLRVDNDGPANPLNPRTDFRNHSPDGFEWGYGGSGPAQLALALLLDSVDPYEAEACYHEYKWRVVSNLPKEKWELSQEEIRFWVAAHLTARPEVRRAAQALRDYDTLSLGEEMP